MSSFSGLKSHQVSRDDVAAENPGKIHPRVHGGMAEKNENVPDGG